MDIDLWTGTRHCPTCGSAKLKASRDEDGMITTDCAGCGRHLSAWRPGKPRWDDAEWVKSTEQ